MVFDKDGTLFDTLIGWRAWATSLSALLQDVGASTSHFNQAIGIDDRGVIDPDGQLATKHWTDLLDTAAATLHATRGGSKSAARAQVEAWHAEIYPADGDADAPPLIDDVAGLIDALRADGVRVAINTSDDGGNVARQLEAQGVDVRNAIDVIVSADDGLPPKPAPESSMHVCAALGLEPDEVWMVGDSGADAGTARAAGLGRFVGVLTGVCRAAEDFGVSEPPGEDTVVVVDDAASVAELVRQHNAAGALAADWHFPVRARFGPGRARELPGVLGGLGSARPLLVTDDGLAGSPIVDGLLGAVEDAGLDVAVFAAAGANPTDAQVAAGAEALRLHGADAVVAVGGGSAMDAGKAISLTAYTGLSLDDVEWTAPEPATLPPGTHMPPVVTVPTTAGTGAEMDSASMVTDTARRIKLCVQHPACAVTALCDPLLTVSLPRALTAYTGLDALTHAVEALLVDAHQPLLDGCALEAARAIGLWLPRAAASPGDLEARAQMMSAAAAAGVAFQKGLGAAHGLSEPVGAVHGTQHGLTNAVLLPHVLELNRDRPHVAAKCRRLARFCGLTGANNEGADAVDVVKHWVEALCAELDVPRTLAAIGVDGASAAECAEKAAANPTGWDNPGGRLTAAEYEGLFWAAFE